MQNSKYSKVLTVILIISIIAIIGLIIFVGIDWYKAYMANSDSEESLGQFNSYINNVNTTDQEGNNQIDNSEIITPNIDTNTENTTNSQSGNSNKPLTYKGFEVAGRIEIPKTKVNYYLLNDASPKAMETAIVVLYGPGPNKVGNTVLAGHNFRNGTFFSNNKKLQEGDKIYITDMEGKRVEYEIYHIYTTNEHDFSYAVRDTGGKREISLTTCTDDSKNRLIIWAKEK